MPSILANASFTEDAGPMTSQPKTAKWSASSKEAGARHPVGKTRSGANEKFSQDGNEQVTATRRRQCRGLIQEGRSEPHPQDVEEDFSPHAPNGEPGSRSKAPLEGPPENRPRGYLPEKDDPESDRDAAGENLRDPEESDLGDALKTRGDR